MKLAAGSVLLLFSVSAFSVPVFGQALTDNAASASAEKRVESLKLFNAPAINPEERPVPPGWVLSPPRQAIRIARTMPVSRPRICASPLLEAKPPANREDVMPVIRPSPPPTGGRDTFGPMPACGESVSVDR